MIVGKAPFAVTGPYEEIVLPDPRRLPRGWAYVIAEPELAVVTRGGTAPERGRGTQRHRRVRRSPGHYRARPRVRSYPVTVDMGELPAKTLGESIDTFCSLGPGPGNPGEATAAGAPGVGVK